MNGIALGIGILFMLVILFLFAAGVRIIKPWEQALYIRLGVFVRRLNPGFRWVVPMVSQVIKLDLRTQVLDVARQDVITKDNSPTQVDAVIYIRIVDPEKSYFEVTNYRLATIALAQTTLRSTIGEMELDEVLYNRAVINTRLRDILDEATDAWGVKVEAVEIREVEPIARVKQAMEEQTSAERERRAAILRADGDKRSKILVAEGDKRGRILEAEGLRQSKILEAEGERIARILEAQGDAQKLRIIALGSAPLDQKSLTFLSLQTLKSVAEGQATKIVFPFEITKLIEGVSEYVGAGHKIPERTPTTYEELEKHIGKPDEILGKIPTPAELKRDLDAIEKALEKDMAQTAKLMKTTKNKETES